MYEAIEDMTWIWGKELPVVADKWKQEGLAQCFKPLSSHQLE